MQLLLPRIYKWRSNQYGINKFLLRLASLGPFSSRCPIIKFCCMKQPSAILLLIETCLLLLWLAVLILLCLELSWIWLMPWVSKGRKFAGLSCIFSALFWHLTNLTQLNDSLSKLCQSLRRNRPYILVAAACLLSFCVNVPNKSVYKIAAIAVSLILKIECNCHQLSCLIGIPCIIGDSCLIASS